MRVPDGVCVSTRGTLGVGEAELPSGRGRARIGLDHAAAASGPRELVSTPTSASATSQVDRPLGGPCA